MITRVMPQGFHFVEAPAVCGCLGRSKYRYMPIPHHRISEPILQPETLFIPLSLYRSTRTMATTSVPAPDQPVALRKG